MIPGTDSRGAAAAPAPLLARVENAVSIAILCAMAILPLLEIAGRHLWRTGVPGSAMFVQHGTLWIAFLGAAIAAREGNLLALGAAADLLPARFRAVGSGSTPAPSPPRWRRCCASPASASSSSSARAAAACSPISPCGSPRR